MHFICHTDGSGYWSNVKKAVICNEMVISYLDEPKNFGELRVYFDMSSWEIKEDGLIYTDKLFLQELRKALIIFGFTQTAVNEFLEYSEQGMQGLNYVSFDITDYFIDEALKNTNIKQEFFDYD
jgi:hypothetical protein